MLHYFSLLFHKTYFFKSSDSMLLTSLKEKLGKLGKVSITVHVLKIVFIGGKPGQCRLFLKSSLVAPISAHNRCRFPCSDVWDCDQCCLVSVIIAGYNFYFFAPSYYTLEATMTHYCLLRHLVLQNKIGAAASW